MLKLSIDDLSRIFERNHLKEVKKITAFIENKLEQIENLKRQVQETMFENEKVIKEISKWGHQLEDRLKELIQGRLEMEATIEKFRIAEEEKSRTEEAELEAIKLLKRIQKELKIEEARIKIRVDLERADQELIKKYQFKNWNVETFHRRLIKNIREKPFEGS